jgi:hypothetical protein
MFTRALRTRRDAFADLTLNFSFGRLPFGVTVGGGLTVGDVVGRVVGLAVAIAEAVAHAVGLAVGLVVAVALAVALALAVGLAAAVEHAVGLAVALPVGLADAVALALAVGDEPGDAEAPGDTDGTGVHNGSTGRPVQTEVAAARIEPEAGLTPSASSIGTTQAATAAASATSADHLRRRARRCFCSLDIR